MQAAPRHALSYVLAYLVWLVSIAACVAALLQFQSAVNVLGVALGANRYALRLGNQVILLLGGLAAFVYVIFLEGYYREGVGRGVLMRRFVKTIAVPLGVAVVSLALVEIALPTIH
jgi:hypothetical protein